MSEPLVPYFSELVSPPMAKPATKWFGTTWQEVVTRVEGFRFLISGHIDWVVNFTHDEERSSMQRYVAVEHNQLFFLYPGEYITKVEVASNNMVITGLRIHTPKRFTPWLGSRGPTRTSFEARDGFCINAFRGAPGSTGCSQLGVVYVPLEVAQEGRSLDTPGPTFATTYLKYYGEDHEFDLGLRTCFQMPRAIVSTLVNGGVSGVRVVSCTEYDRLGLFDGELEPNVAEHWVVLSVEERILSVGVGMTHKQVVSISFSTNMQTTPEFGGVPPEDATLERFDCVGTAGRYIAGLYTKSKGQLRGEQTIVGIAVEYENEVPQLSHTSTAVAEEHASKAA